GLMCRTRVNPSSGGMRGLRTRRLYCSGVPPGPGKAGIGVPSVRFDEMRLFLNDCTTPALVALTPVTLRLMVESPIRASALPAPLAAAPLALMPLAKLPATTE